MTPTPRPSPPPSRPAGRPTRYRAAGLAGVGGLALTAAVLPAGTSAATSRTTAARPASAPVPAADTVSATAVTTVADGAAATVALTLGSASTTPVTVAWRTGTGTATAGSDYRAASGSVTFPAGSAAGTTRTLRLATLHTAAPETAETVRVVLSATGATLTGDAPVVVIDAHGLPYLNPRLPVAARVQDLVSRMTLAEKVGEMTQAERGSVDASRGQITSLNLGSLLSGGGSVPTPNTPAAWANMVDAYQSYALATRLQIPLIYGIDSVHGDGNLYGATLFPHNVGMGSTRDPALVAQEEHVTATETRSMGVPWVFAPCLCVARDDRWGRTYESFGEDPSLVIAMETSIDGFQGTTPRQLASSSHVLATAKHFAADGDTTYGSGRNSAGASGSDYPIDQGITQQSRAHVAKIDLAPYVPAVRTHHVGSVMPSYSSIDYTDDGLGNPLKMHANAELVQGWLKDKVGFDGFVISDYNGIHQIPPTGADDPSPYQVRTAVNAGVDMAMEPSSYQQFETRLTAEVDAGRVTRARVDDAVSRILTKKFQLGLFEHPYADRTHIKETGDPAHRAVARRAAAESQVLLKNTGNLLPLAKNAHVYVAGRNADNLGNQLGGWSITWQGESGTHTRGTTILAGMRQVAPGATITYSQDASAPTTGSDVGVVVVGETPYSEGFGDVGGPQWAYDPADAGVPREPKTMELKTQDQATVDKVCSALPKCVVLVVSGRPQVLTGMLPEITSLVASWLPGTEGEGVADVLFGNRPFTGQLSQTWPRSADQEPVNVGDASYRPLFPFGWGLTTQASGPASTVAAQLRRAAGVARGETTAAPPVEHQLVRWLRLYVQNESLDPSTGVPAVVADHIARADVATLKGDLRTAITLLLQVAH